jgi:hypothetical protein
VVEERVKVDFRNGLRGLERNEWASYGVDVCDDIMKA